MKQFSRAVAVLCVAVLLLSAMGCSAKGHLSPVFKKSKSVSVESQTVAENDKLALLWDDAYKQVFLQNKRTGKCWGTVPQAVYDRLTDETDETAVSGDLCSPIMVHIVEKTTLTSDWDKAYGICIPSKEDPDSVNGSVKAVCKDDGITVTYSFNKYEISIPVEYRLREDSLAVSVNMADICEGDTYRLQYFTLCNMLCSVENDSDGYLFVPSGNGALMLPRTDANGKRTYGAEVYGTDTTRVLHDFPFDEERVKMPVFGAKAGADALLAITEDGAESVSISAAAGDSGLGYSYVCADCYARGYDVIEDDFTWGSTVTTRVADHITDQTVTVGYYPLDGDAADYVGMAKRYQRYLTDGGMKPSEQTAQHAYALQFLGNVNIPALALGIPYEKLANMTSFADVLAILKDVEGETGLYPDTLLTGFGKNGVDVGEIGGGFAFAKASGTKKDFRALTELGKTNGFVVSADFDLLRFSSGGSGVSTLSDAAKSAALYKSKQYYTAVALREHNKKAGAFYYVRRSKIAKLIDKLCKKADRMDLTAVNLGTLSTVTYSDYALPDYYGKKNTANDFAKAFETVKKSGRIVTAQDANDFAAVASDTVFGVDITDQALNAIDTYVPFYELVFKGYRPLYSDPLNIADDYDTALATALSYGLGLGYSVIKEYDTAYTATPHRDLYNVVFDDNREKIISAVKQYADYYAAIADSEMTDYRREGALAVTVYANGVTAYTNFSDKACETPAGTVEAHQLIFTKGDNT